MIEIATGGEGGGRTGVSIERKQLTGIGLMQSQGLSSQAAAPAPVCAFNPVTVRIGGDSRGCAIAGVSDCWDKPGASSGCVGTCGSEAVRRYPSALPGEEAAPSATSAEGLGAPVLDLAGVRLARL